MRTPRNIKPVFWAAARRRIRDKSSLGQRDNQFEVGLPALFKEATMTGKKKKYNTLQKTETRDAWIMMAPAIIMLLIIAVYPVLRTIWLSLHEMVLTDPGSGYPFIGLENYINILTNV